MITDGSTSILFGRVDGYEPPSWPDSAAPKRYHMDLDVDNVAEAVERCLELGASKPDFQPGDGDRWTVLLDPAGHPFCVSGLRRSKALVARADACPRYVAA